MAWWEKGIKSVREQAEKVSFEAEKLVRIRREESTLGDVKGKVQAKMVELGQIALALHRNGTLADPDVAIIAQDVAGMEAQMKQLQARIDAIRAEQWQAPAEAPGAPAISPQAMATVPPVPQEPAGQEPVPQEPMLQEAVAPEPASAGAAPGAPAPVTQLEAAPATVECPNCHTAAPASAAFCPECGTRLLAA